MILTLSSIVRTMGGEIRGDQALVPGPGHSPKDRSLAIKLDPHAPDGFVVYSHCGDDHLTCRDYFRREMGMPGWQPAARPNGGDGSAQDCHEISYIYRDPGGVERYRKKRIEFASGGKTFVIEPKGRGGSAPLLYGGERLADVPEGGKVFVVEGEKKVDKLQKLGFAAVSLDSGAQSKWLPDHAALLRGLKVILWPDSDQPGEEYIAAAAKAIMADDPRSDIRVVRPFGSPNGAKGRDVCDWTGGAAQLAKMAADAARYGQAGTPLLSYEEMMREALTKWAIKDVWPARSKTVIFGQSDSFKSFIAVDIACSVATGREWHGHSVQKMPVVYIANEGAGAVGRKRIPAWMAAHDIPRHERRDIYLVKAEAILPDEKSMASLVAGIRAIIPEGEDFGIIIDVLRGTMTGSENDDEAAHAWTKAAEFLIEGGATILTLTHSPYGDDGRMRGSSHLWGSFDTRLQVTGDKDNMSAVLKVNRHKDADSGGEWGFKLEEHSIDEAPGETSLVPRLDGEVKTKSPRLSTAAKFAYETLIETMLDFGQIPPTSGQIPRNVKAVTLNQWGDKYASRTGGDMGDKHSTERRAFFRAKSVLYEAKLIGISKPYVWVTQVTK